MIYDKAARSRLRLESIVGEVHRGRCGIGYGEKKYTQKGSPAQLDRKAVADTVGKAEDEKLFIKAVQQGLQGQWTKWQKIMKRDMS